MQICIWQDGLLKKHMPPSWMWHLDEELIDHFDWVAEDRKEGGGDDDDDDEDKPRRRRDRTVAMERNDYARGRGRDS